MPPTQRMSADRRRLTFAVLLSLLIHAPLFSLAFGGEKLGLPGFEFPWKKRRIEVPDLHVVIMPARAAAEPAEPAISESISPASIEPVAASTSLPTPSAFSASTLARPADVIDPKLTSTIQAEPKSEIATNVAPAKMPLRTEAPDAAPPPIPQPEVIAVERSDKATFAVPPPPPAPAPVVAVAPSAIVAPIAETVTPAPREVVEVEKKRVEPEVRERVAEVAKPDPSAREAEQKQRQKADQLEAARIETAQREAARQEAAQRETTRLEAERKEAARLAAAKAESLRQELARQEAARIEIAQREAARLAAAKLETQRQADQLAAARLEVARAEAARLEAQRQEAARVDSAKLDAQRQEAARQEAVRQAAAQKEAARIQEEKEEDARRDARRQAMGRILNEEAARRDAAAANRPSSSLPHSLSTARRGRLWGRADPNLELVQYAETWARKIQFNTLVDTVREVATRPHTHPMVTVAIRSDGSVESVTFVVSSGVAEVDDAIRRIVQSHMPYPAFPPGLASEYDVIEVRRTWHFDTAIRLN